MAIVINEEVMHHLFSISFRWNKFLDSLRCAWNPRTPFRDQHSKNISIIQSNRIRHDKRLGNGKGIY